MKTIKLKIRNWFAKRYGFIDITEYNELLTKHERLNREYSDVTNRLLKIYRQQCRDLIKPSGEYVHVTVEREINSMDNLDICANIKVNRESLLSVLFSRRDLYQALSNQLISKFEKWFNDESKSTYGLLIPLEDNEL